MFKTKILILGPCESGKTTIANYLADATEITGGDYRPTHGVRIVEFESNDLELNGQNIDAEVELWDCSGSKKFEKCWPAIQKDANGVILVCNPAESQQVREIEQWYQIFVARRGIKQSHVMVFAHHKPEGEGTMARNPEFSELRLPPSMGGVEVLTTSIEADGEALRLEFNNFLCNVISGLTGAARLPSPKPGRLLAQPPPSAPPLEEEPAEAQDDDEEEDAHSGFGEEEGRMALQDDGEDEEEDKAFF